MQLTGGSITLVSVTISNPMTLAYYGNNTTAPNIDFEKNRGTSTSPLVIVTGDELGVINFRGYDTDSLVTGASIKGISTGTIADTRIPAVLEFWTGTNAAPTVNTKRLTIDEVGKLTVVGAADADKFTITAGDVKITLGDIRLTNGIVTVDTATDQASYVIRNFAGAGTDPVLTVRDDHASSTNVALLVDQDGTGASTALKVVHDGDNPAIDLSAGAARTGDVIKIAMANQLGQRAINITGAMTSVAGGGVIEVQATGVIPATAALLRLDADTAQPGDGDGWMMNVDDDTLVVATPSKYAVLIDSASNEALHVATGKTLHDESITITGAADADQLTLTNGDIKLTLGDLRFTNGILTADWATDQTCYFKRNQGITTGPAVEIETTAAGDDNAALLVDHNATGAIDAIEVTNAGTGAALNLTGEAAGSKGIVIDVANSATARAVFCDLGPWLGTADEGAVEIKTDAAATIPAGQLLRLDQNGTGQHAGAIGGSVVFIDEQAAAPGAGTSYAVYINAANVEALRVDAGVSLFDESITITGAADADQLTLTNGDIKLTLGDVRLTNGVVQVDTGTNQSTYFKRDMDITTGPVVEIETTNISDDNPALLIDHNVTGAVAAVKIESEAGAYALDIDVNKTNGSGLRINAVNSFTGKAFNVDLGTWLGGTGEGALEITSDAAATIPAGQFVRLNQQGTGQHAAAIEGTVLYVKDAATAPAAGTSYAVVIDATNIEGLFVKTGLARFDEGASMGNATDSRLRTDTVEITNAQIKALRATPKELVAAPGADYIVEVESAVLILDYGTEVLTESVDNLVIEYTTSGTDITGAIEATGFIDASVDTIMFVRPTITNVSATNSVNLAVQLVNTGDGEYGGNASNDTTMTVKITYRIHKVGL